VAGKSDAEDGDQFDRLAPAKGGGFDLTKILRRTAAFADVCLMLNGLRGDDLDTASTILVIMKAVLIAIDSVASIRQDNRR
jgi:hypothetical protein